MAKKFNVPIDLSYLELQNVRLHILETHPVPSDPEALIYYNNDTKKITFHNGTQWVSLEDSGSVSGVTSLSATGPLSRDVSTGDVTISIANASAETAGSMSTTHYSLLAAATNNNTASTLVARDSSGNFSAGTITASLTGSASQLNGQNASHYLDRANHSGTQAASTITDLATVVKAYRLDEFGVPTSAVSLNSQKITNLATPEDSTDAANKAYVDSISAGIDFKESVIVATTEDISLEDEQTIDGVELVEGDRVLVWQQENPEENGIYVVVDGDLWLRASDAVTGALTSGAWVYVEDGTLYGGYKFVLATNDPITVGTTELDWVIYGAGEILVAGDGLDKTGDTFSVLGTANRISVSETGVDIDSTYAGQTSIITLGTVTTGTWQGTAIGAAYGGTGISTYTTNNYIRASSSTTLEQRTPSEVLGDIGAAASSHNHTLASLEDVDLDGVEEGNILVYNEEGDWVASAPTPGVSIGTIGQIPYTDSDGEDFDYSSVLTFGSSTLNVAVSHSTTTPNLTLTNSDTGDAGIRLGVTGRSYYMGIDNSDSDVFSIYTDNAIDNAVASGTPLVRLSTAGAMRVLGGLWFGTGSTGDSNLTVHDATGFSGSLGDGSDHYGLLGAGTSTRVTFRGNNGGTITNGVSHAAVFIGAQTATEAGSGTHPLVAAFAIKPIALTNGSATTTNGATLYIEGATTGTATITNNYAMWIDDGSVRVDSLAAAASETNIVTVNDVGVLSSSSIDSLIPSGIARKYAENIEDDEEDTVFVIEHNLDTTDVTFNVWNTDTGFEEIVDVEIIDANSIEVSFASPPAVIYRVVVVG